MKANIVDPEMDMSYSSIAVFSCIVLFLVGLWEFLNWSWFTPKKLEKKLKDQGLKGYPYKFPFISFQKASDQKQADIYKPMNLYDNDFASRVLSIDPEAIKEYGKCFYSFFRQTSVLVVLEPELIKEVTVRNYDFVKVPYNPLANMLMKGITILDRDEWSKHRKIITPAFHTEKVKLMVPAFCKSIGEMLTKWEEIVSPKGSSEIDVWPYFQRLTGDVISRTAFGSNYEEGKVIFELQKEQTVHFLHVLLQRFLGIMRFLPIKRHRRVKEISRIVDDKIRCMVDARMKAVKAGKGFGDDFLGLLLESNSKEIHEHGSKDFGLTIQEVIEECKLLYVAGQETTAVLLVWTMFLLGRHPEWQNRAREEVLQLFGPHQLPDYGALNQLKIVTMILNEALRLYTPPTALIRTVTEDTKLGNLIIPKGVVLLLPILFLHQYPEYWGNDAKQFNPERFAGISNASRGKFPFFAFSWGPRSCLGQNFAMTEAKMAISMILQHFSFEIAPSYTHYPYHAGLTLQPMYGAQLILHKL